MNDFYAVPANWKTLPLKRCETAGMDLYMGMMLLPWHHRMGWLKKPRVIQMPPFELNLSCKCKYCRYFRWRAKYE